MKIKLIKLKNFKRFTDLTIEGLPETAKLVVMIGPNGCGKSSVFDALHRYRLSEIAFGVEETDPYYAKFDLSEKIFKEPEVEFHTSDPETSEEWKKCVHVRSTYRGHLASEVKFGVQVSPITEEHRFGRMIEDDQAFASNYARLMNQLMERISASDEREKKVGELQDEIFGELRRAIERLFSDQELILDSLGNPAEGNIFDFNKGTSQGFSYQNLSSGEKAALDLLLDLTVVKVEFNDTVFCIDEPEAHIHTKLQGPLLEELYNLIPDKSQLWIATHSIGMVRKAQELWRDDPNSVAFLDFGKDDSGKEHDFDGPVKIEPVKPNPNFWASTYEVALGDLAALVTPQRIVLCESKAQDPTKAFDAACYNQIFGSRYPDTRFISIGGEKDVAKADTHLIPVIEAIAAGVKILRLRDRDRANKQDIIDNAKKGIRILSRKYIEKYLTDNEVLEQLCVSEEKPDKVAEFLAAKDREIEQVMNNDKIHDKRRPIVQRIQQQAEQILGLVHSGDTTESFMRNILAPLIQPGMKVYEELHEDIFGE